MQVDHTLAAGSLMEVIHILGHHGQPGHMPGKLSDSEMSTIGLRLSNLLPAPLVPSPAKTRIRTECFRGRQLRWIKTLPQSTQRISECWDATFR